MIRRAMANVAPTLTLPRKRGREWEGVRADEVIR